MGASEGLAPCTRGDRKGAKPAAASTLIDEVRIEGVVLTCVEHAPGCVLDDHAHEGATIGVLLAGGVAERRDGLVDVQAPGDVFIRRKGVRHANQYLPLGARSLFVELEPDDPRAVAVGALDGLSLPELSAAGGSVARAFGGHGFAGHLDLQRRVEALVSSAAALRPRSTPGWLGVARDRLAEAYQDPPSLRELADDLRVHPVHLAQAFRSRWGLTIGAFIRAHRVFHAVSMIRAGRPLAEVSFACGFADQSHMTRVVRSSRGLPPGRLARAVQ